LYDYQLISSLLDDLLKDIQEFRRVASVDVKEAYEMVLATMIDGVYGAQLKRTDNPILYKMSEKARRICKIALERLRQGLYGPWICEALREMIDLATSQPNRRHVIICDALGIHDVLLLTYELDGRVRPLFAVNAGGMTKTYEYMVKQCPALRGTFIGAFDEPSLTLLARAVAQRVDASGYERYDDFDRSIHSTVTKDFKEVAALLHRTFERLLSKVKAYLNAGFTVLVLADHGYDIDPDTFTLYHGWGHTGTSLSILAPLVVIK